jgi:Signal peptidase, peptidase S26
VNLSFSEISHSAVGLVKYVITLVVLVVIVKVLLPMFWGQACYVDPDDLGMQQLLGKTRLKVGFDSRRWTESDLKRGDLVILNEMSNDSSGARRDFPFRIIAVEGDMLSAYRGVFKINGKEEKYGGLKPVADSDTRIAARRIPRGHVYAMPDNRRDCEGGHPGMLPIWRIVGKVDEL